MGKQQRKMSVYCMSSAFQHAASSSEAYVGRTRRDRNDSLLLETRAKLATVRACVISCFICVFRVWLPKKWVVVLSRFHRWPEGKVDNNTSHQPEVTPGQVTYASLQSFHFKALTMKGTCRSEHVCEAVIPFLQIRSHSLSSLSLVARRRSLVL
jgi:hypothetical protein